MYIYIYSFFSPPPEAETSLYTLDLLYFASHHVALCFIINDISVLIQVSSCTLMEAIVGDLQYAWSWCSVWSGDSNINQLQLSLIFRLNWPGWVTWCRLMPSWVWMDEGISLQQLVTISGLPHCMCFHSRTRLKFTSFPPVSIEYILTNRHPLRAS